MAALVLPKSLSGASRRRNESCAAVGAVAARGESAHVPLRVPRRCPYGLVGCPPSLSGSHRCLHGRGNGGPRAVAFGVWDGRSDSLRRGIGGYGRRRGPLRGGGRSRVRPTGPSSCPAAGRGEHFLRGSVASRGVARSLVRPHCASGSGRSGRGGLSSWGEATVSQEALLRMGIGREGALSREARPYLFRAGGSPRAHVAAKW